jgi:hypothetical protein
MADQTSKPRWAAQLLRGQFLVAAAQQLRSPVQNAAALGGRHGRPDFETALGCRYRRVHVSGRRVMHHTHQLPAGGIEVLETFAAADQRLAVDKPWYRIVAH